MNCESNQLTSLDVTNNVGLLNLRCGGNQLSTLDISNNIDIGNQDLLSPEPQVGLYLQDMPSLFKVCVWEMPFPPDGVVVDTTGSPNVYFTTDCSIGP